MARKHKMLLSDLDNVFTGEDVQELSIWDKQDKVKSTTGVPVTLCPQAQPCAKVGGAAPS